MIKIAVQDVASYVAEMVKRLLLPQGFREKLEISCLKNRPIKVKKNNVFMIHVKLTGT